MKTNYPGHDRVYRDKRSRGEPGWDAPDQARATLMRLDEFLADVPFAPRPLMLEFGCGAGEVTLHFAQKGFAAHGLDISPTAIQWARQKASEQGIAASFFVADVTRELALPIPPVHLLIDGHCLHCIIGPDRAAFFRNARKYLRPDGLLCIDTMCGDPRSLPPDQTFDPQTRCVVHKGIAARYLGLPDAILREIADGGFSLVKRRVIPPADEKDQDSLLALARPLAAHGSQA